MIVRSAREAGESQHAFDNLTDAICGVDQGFESSFEFFCIEVVGVDLVLNQRKYSQDDGQGSNFVQISAAISPTEESLAAWAKRSFLQLAFDLLLFTDVDSNEDVFIVFIGVVRKTLNLFYLNRVKTLLGFFEFENSFCGEEMLGRSL